VNGTSDQGRPVRSLSLAEVDDELTSIERRLAELQAARGRSYQQSSSGAAAVRDMAGREREIQNRPKLLGRFPRRSDSAELQSLRAEKHSQAELADRSMAEMRAISEETRELSKRQQLLNTRRAELLNQSR
jgi:hypothetical protein